MINDYEGHPLIVLLIVLTCVDSGQQSGTQLNLTQREANLTHLKLWYGQWIIIQDKSQKFY